MKRIHKYIVGLTASIVFFGSFSVASAALQTWGQPVFNTQSGASYNTVIQSLGTGHSGAFTDLQMKYYVFSFTSGGTIIFQTQVSCYDNQARSSATGACINANSTNTYAGATTTRVVSGNNQVLDFSGPISDRSIDIYNDIPMTLDPNKYYFASVNYVGGSGTFNFGPLGFAGSSPYPTIPNPAGAIGAAYFSASSFDPANGNSSTISPITSPAPNATTGSTDVQFTFTYYNACSELYTQVGIRLVDNTNQSNVATPAQAIISCGTSTYNANLPLVSGHLYSVQPTLFGSASSTPLLGSLTFFSVVSAFTPDNSSVVPIGDITEANASSTILSSYAQMLNIPNLFRTKFPFSFVYSIATMYETATPDDTAFPGVEFNFASIPGLATTTRDFLPADVVLFSTTTISTYLPDPIRNVFRGICVAVLFLGWIYILFRRVTGSMAAESR